MKVVDCPLHDQTSIAFVVNQLVDPSHNRPIKKLSENADRHYKWNTVSGNWEYRYTNSPRGKVKNTIYTKKTSMTLLPPNGKMNLFNYNHGVILIFDRDACLLSDQYIFAENVLSNDRWWIWGNSGIAPKRAIALDDLIKINYRNMNRDFVGSHNEILAKLTQSGFSGVAAPIDSLFCRLNTLRIGYFIKLRLHLPFIDFLIIAATVPAKIYDEHQQSADIGHAFATGEQISFQMACNLVNYATLLQNQINVYGFRFY